MEIGDGNEGVCFDVEKLFDRSFLLRKPWSYSKSIKAAYDNGILASTFYLRLVMDKRASTFLTNNLGNFRKPLSWQLRWLVAKSDLSFINFSWSLKISFDALKKREKIFNEHFFFVFFSSLLLRKRKKINLNAI